MTMDKKSKKPEWMITYFCPRCQMDSGRTELDPPLCYFCEQSDGLTELKREKLTPEVLFGRMQMATNRMMENLEKAMAIEGKGTDDKEEMMLLQAMAMGQELQQEIKKLGTKAGKRKKKIL